MNMCYNIFMKNKLLILLIFFFSFVPMVFAKEFEVVVLPMSIVEERQNFYAFENPDEVVAGDVIKNFNQSFKVHSPDLYELNAKLNSSDDFKTYTKNAVKTFKATGEIDYDSLKHVAEAFNAHSVLLIYDFVTPKTGKAKRDIYEVLYVNSVFDIQNKNEMKTEAVLLDNVNDLVMWSATYRNPLSDKVDSYKALTYADAFAQCENLKLYSKDILSKNIAQNVTLRFYPKSVRAVDVKTTGEKMDSGIFKFDKDVPTIDTLIKKSLENNKENTSDDEPDGFDENKYGEIILGL
jgi:hypothetical protein